MNVEYRMSKECILTILKKTEQSETTLRHSAVGYSAVLRFAFFTIPSFVNRHSSFAIILRASIRAFNLGNLFMSVWGKKRAAT